MMAIMWNEPYLETCCRAALHRVFLAGAPGRPRTEKDFSCLHRLTGMGLTCTQAGGNVVLTDVGATRHASEILRHPV